MFSTMAALPLSISGTISDAISGLLNGGADKFGGLRVLQTPNQVTEPKRTSLSLGWPSIDALLPDGGLPRGVVELSSRGALGGPTRIAARAVAMAHAARAQSWAAWLDPEATLHAPGLSRMGVDLARLFVVRPPRADLGRIAVKVARAGAFDVVVVDMDALGAGITAAAWPPPYPLLRSPLARNGERSKSGAVRRPLPPEVIVRKLALAAEEGECTVILLTDANQSRAVQWPVALRLELERRPDALSVRVAKDHRGRTTVARTWVPVTELSRSTSSGTAPVTETESPFKPAPEMRVIA